MSINHSENLLFWNERNQARNQARNESTANCSKSNVSAAMMTTQNWTSLRLNAIRSHSGPECQAVRRPARRSLRWSPMHSDQLDADQRPSTASSCQQYGGMQRSLAIRTDLLAREIGRSINERMLGGRRWKMHLGDALGGVWRRTRRMMQLRRMVLGKCRRAFEDNGALHLRRDQRSSF